MPPHKGTDHGMAASGVLLIWRTGTVKYSDATSQSLPHSVKPFEIQTAGQLHTLYRKCLCKVLFWLFHLKYHLKGTVKGTAVHKYRQKSHLFMEVMLKNLNARQWVAVEPFA